jgi:GTPase SAR1 family protein
MSNSVFAVFLIPLVAPILLRAVRAARGRSDNGDAAAQQKAKDVRAPAYVPPTFKVVALGASGAGKTVFLASMFHKLNFQAPNRSYYLQTDARQRVALGRIYSTISDTAQGWPVGTREGETREFVFDCVGVDASNAQHTVLRMSYLDYAGELLGVDKEPGGAPLDDLAERIKEADALLGMIDGRHVLQLLRNERAGREYFQHSLQPMFGFMQAASCPIHLILTKWDLVRDYAGPSEASDQVLLDRVIDALMGYEHIKSLVYVHSRNQIVRLIPVSAVGSSFAELDGAGKVVKRADGEMRPTNVEVPLCAVLPDLFKQIEASLDQSAQRGVNAEMLRQMRRDGASMAVTALGRPLRLVLQGALGRDAGVEAATLFLEWLARPSTEEGALNRARTSLEHQVAELQRLRVSVIEDFKRTVLRLEAVLPNSQLSQT